MTDVHLTTCGLWAEGQVDGLGSVRGEIPGGEEGL